MELSAAFKLIISLALGAAIGLEREVHERHDKAPEAANKAFIGLRTFSLITALGTVSALLYPTNIALSLTITITFMALLLAHYILNCWVYKDIGITTELAVIFGYIIGQSIGLSLFPIQLIIAITVVLILILSYKEKIKDFTNDIEQHEFLAFISYAIIALVILPFLPNKGYTLNDIPNFAEFMKALNINIDGLATIQIFNPFKTWMIVSLITGVDIAGYVLEKTIGQGKGLLISSMVGGFISSTATTQSLAQQSNTSKTINMLVTAAIAANFVSFFPTLFIISTMNAEFFVRSLPTFIIVIITCLIAGFFFFWKNKQDTNVTHKDTSEKRATKIFALEPALKFALIYIAIGAASKIAIEFFGSSGFLITSAIGALTGIDAVMINTAELAGKAVSYKTAVIAFIIINAVNLLGKTSYSFLQGKREFALKFGVSMLCVIAASFIGLLFI